MKAVIKMMKPICDLTGTDGDASAVIGLVKLALIKSDQLEKSKEYSKRAVQALSYWEVMNITYEYVEVSRI
jgi:hypothetical protein